MNRRRWHRWPGCTTAELLEVMADQGVDRRRLDATARFITDPRDLPCDRAPTLVLPTARCPVCGTPADTDTAHTVDVDGTWFEVHVECCPECQPLDDRGDR